MPAPASAPDATTRLRSAVEIGVVALSALIALGAAAVFLLLPGAGGAEDRDMLTATAIPASVVSSRATAAVSRASTSLPVAPAPGVHTSTGSATAGRSSRPDSADWVKIKAASGLRRLALAPHRTSHFRVFAAFLGLSELASIHRLAPGRCLTAVTGLYNNLLDLENAYPGENWDPLRRAVAKEASIDACAPRPPGEDGA